RPWKHATGSVRHAIARAASSSSVRGGTVTDIERGDGATIAAPRETRFRLLDAERIAVCWGSSTELLAWADVVSVHSVRNFSVITACNRMIKVRATLRAVVAELAPLGLMQVRRDTAVNFTR